MEVGTVVAADAAVLTPAEDCSFNCNICLRFARDPVVTLCGHLYCWPCIYNGLEAGSHHCSACTTPISHNSVIPLYGQGGVVGSHEIPCRPPAQRPAITDQQDHHPDPYQGYVSSSPLLSTTEELLGGTVALAILRPWVSGYDEPGRGMNYSSNERVRRQELRIEGLLHQLWLFLFYLALLCLVFF